MADKKKMTNAQEFEIMKLVLDKFLWLGFIVMGWGMYTAINDSAIAYRPEPGADQVLGANNSRWIEVDLGRQKLIAHDGDQIFLESLISSGLGNRTPVGEYRIWYKIRSTKMEGGNRLTKSYYYLPNVPYAMFFFGSYGIHGTYWHNNFGNRMSHGCVNAPTPIAEKLFLHFGIIPEK